MWVIIVFYSDLVASWCQKLLVLSRGGSEVPDLAPPPLSECPLSYLGPDPGLRLDTPETGTPL